MGTLDEAIQTMQAALAPGADAAAKAQAATMLRALLAVVESTPGAPLTLPEASTPPPEVDVLGAILDKLRSLLPKDVQAPTVPRLDIPLVVVPAKR